MIIEKKHASIECEYWMKGMLVVVVTENKCSGLWDRIVDSLRYIFTAEKASAIVLDDGDVMEILEKLYLTAPQLEINRSLSNKNEKHS
jgi:hypothetical protein